jgi:diadenosine tetraphosphate (Ap4A) HIT family hydrolase
MLLLETVRGILDRMDCPLCKRLVGCATLDSSPSAVAVPDAYPVAPGHTLVLPRRHEPDFFHLTAEEQRDVLQVVLAVRERLVRESAPDGFNIGVNLGEAAGQTILHAHVHVIPRRKGDVEDPRGGVRWVVPARARYWS